MGIFDKIKGKLDLNSLENRKNELIKKNKQNDDNELAIQINNELIEIEEKIKSLKNEN